METIQLLMENVAKPTIVLNLYWKCNQTKSQQFWDRVFNYSKFEQQLVKYLHMGFLNMHWIELAILTNGWENKG
jgi:hypothetical protein